MVENQNPLNIVGYHTRHKMHRWLQFNNPALFSLIFFFFNCTEQLPVTTVLKEHKTTDTKWMSLRGGRLYLWDSILVKDRLGSKSHPRDVDVLSKANVTWFTVICIYCHWVIISLGSTYTEDFCCCWVARGWGVHTSPQPFVPQVSISRTKLKFCDKSRF